MSDWLPLIPPFLAVIVAAIVAFIGWQQWRIAEYTLKEKLFDRRFQIYLQTQKYLSDVATEGDVKNNMLPEFITALQRSYFLFGSDIPAYLDEIFRRSQNARSFQHRLEGLPVGDKRTAMVDSQMAEIGWLIDQLPLLKEKFAPYIHFDK